MAGINTLRSRERVPVMGRLDAFVSARLRSLTAMFAALAIAGCALPSDSDNTTQSTPEADGAGDYESLKGAVNVHNVIPRPNYGPDMKEIPFTYNGPGQPEAVTVVAVNAAGDEIQGEGTRVRVSLDAQGKGEALVNTPAGASIVMMAPDVPGTIPMVSAEALTPPSLLQ